MAVGTTLVTFFFECPVPASSVELLGSWDNFDRPYHLKRDRRRGSKFWAGCFTFEDIICDGDPSNTSPKRSGALKVGGTYWYFYKVNNDEEHYNPSQPFTTFCPLLPGQRLNILELPTESMESMIGSGSQTSDVFTRNPEDRFLTPVPPKACTTLRLGELCSQPSYATLRSTEGPRSATYPPSTPSLSPGYEQRSRSASTSPRIGSGSSGFMDLKGFKEKTAALKQTVSPSRGRTNARELQIGQPVLVSTSAGDIGVVPLAPHAPKISRSIPAHITARLREFSPLGSHPIKPSRNLDPVTLGHTEGRTPSRPRSHATPAIKVTSGRIRANSSETRRTKQYQLFSNEPWISSPKLPSHSDMVTDAAPLLQRPYSAIVPPSVSPGQRPMSRHGGDSSLHPHSSSSDKTLPALPRYLVPAPLFACNSTDVAPAIEEDGNHDIHEVEQSATCTPQKRGSQISTWSADSTTFSSLSSDDGAINSPTFSSFTTSSSQAASLQRESFRASDTFKGNYDSREDNAHDKNGGPGLPPSPSHAFTSSPLPRLSVTAAIPKLFDMELYHSEYMPRRQAACFGYPDTQGYGVPESATTVHNTSSNALSSPVSDFDYKRSSSVSQLDKLVSEFGFLGQAVH